MTLPGRRVLRSRRAGYPRAGCDQASSKQTAASGLFQSSPYPRAGCDLRRSRSQARRSTVSILTLPEGRVRRRETSANLPYHRGLGDGERRASARTVAQPRQIWVRGRLPVREPTVAGAGTHGLRMRSYTIGAGSASTGGRRRSAVVDRSVTPAEAGTGPSPGGMTRSPSDRSPPIVILGTAAGVTPFTNGRQGGF